MTQAAPAAIERIDVFGYELTYVHGDYVMSCGRVVNRLPSTVVRVTTARRRRGLRRGLPARHDVPAGVREGARAAIRELAPALIGVDPTNLADVHRRLDGALRGHGYAKSAIDVACWDAFGRIVGQPVATLLGGVLQASFRSTSPSRSAHPATWRRSCPREREVGIRRFQLKLGADPEDDARAGRGDPGRDGTGRRGHRRRERRLAAAGRDHRRAAARGLRRFRLEQPCPTLEECLAVRRLTTLPMVLDEVIVDLPTLLRAAGLRRDGPDQPQDRPGRRAAAGEADARLGGQPRHPAHDRGQLGRRHRDGRVGHLRPGRRPTRSSRSRS